MAGSLGGKADESTQGYAVCEPRSRYKEHFHTVATPSRLTSLIADGRQKACMIVVSITNGRSRARIDDRRNPPIRRAELPISLPRSESDPIQKPGVGYLLDENA
jgi:hypothetical protein